MKRRDKPGKQDREQQPRRRKDISPRPDKQPTKTEHRETNLDRDNPKVNKRRNHRSERKE